MELDADRDRQLSPNLILTENNSRNKFTTEFTTSRLTDTEFYCTKEDHLMISEGAKDNRDFSRQAQIKNLQ